ncbi:hypothetical protein B7494_g2938 [Chlorociboria aeruginascens]|nr:hypothetical protein B7494_g2938 [Chlorociboria aeruginascens]
MSSQGSPDEGDRYEPLEPTRKRLRHEETPHRAIPAPATVKSCNECRQQKLRCDVVKDPFTACSRCRRSNIECKIDSHFKRVAKRTKHAEMQQEIRKLQQQLAGQSVQPGIATSIHNQPIQEEAVYPSPMSSLNMSSQTLEDVTLSGEQLLFLFEQYFKFYHPLCPLLDPKMNHDFYFSLSPVLAWTVVLVASRRHYQDALLLTKLSSPYKKLLWATISEMPQRYHAVKALAILCNWPIPLVMDVSKRNRSERPVGGLGGGFGLSEMDPTFMLSGIMMQIALQTGLHRPLHLQDFIRQVRDIPEQEVKDRKLTWAVCNIVSQSATSGNGQPSRTIYDWNLGPGLAGGWDPLSVEVEHRLKIEKFCDKVMKSLYSNSSDAVGIIAESEQPTVLRMLRMDVEELDNMVPILSLHFDSVQGKALFNTAILSLRTISVRNNDFPDRVAEALARMWRAAGSGMPVDGDGYDNLELKIRSRMTVSHVYDCIWGWRRTMMKDTNGPSVTSEIPFALQNADISYQQTDIFPNQTNLTSAAEDFDLFNSLDWTFDENTTFTWS